jgi:hypothetical protein
VQAAVRPGIVVKEKDVFHVLFRTNSTDALPQRVYSSLVPLVICSEVDSTSSSCRCCNGIILKGDCEL